MVAVVPTATHDVIFVVFLLGSGHCAGLLKLRGYVLQNSRLDVLFFGAHLGVESADLQVFANVAGNDLKDHRVAIAYSVELLVEEVGGHAERGKRLE